MLYVEECKTGGLPCLNVDFLCGNCFLLRIPSFLSCFSLSTAGCDGGPILGCSFEHIYLPEKELERNRSRNGKAEQRPEFFAWMLNALQ